MSSVWWGCGGVSQHIFSTCRSSIGEEMWKCKIRFALAGFLHYNILELKDLLFFHSHFIDEETEVWGNCELPEVQGQSSLQSVQLGWALSLERFRGEEVGLWGTAVLTPVALKAWSVYLGAVFLNWLGVLNTENLFTAPFSNHSIPRPQWQTAKGKQRERWLPYHRNNSSDAIWGPDLLPPKEFYFLHLEFFSDLRNLQLLNLTTFGWTAQRRRLKHYIFKWLQSYMCGRGGHCHGNLGGQMNPLPLTR